ncbi:phage tail fiber protein [Peptoniphilus sp. SGI.035]|uniref:phage tail fiber protein n=1 Tax=Peptoniphilus sp. SGI.035 TaxID=3420564 RepID=UPI003D0002FA
MQVVEKNRVLKESLISRQVYCALENTKEVVAFSYKRIPVYFTEPMNGQVQNSMDIEFPIAKEDWGNITKISLYDSLTGGNKIWEGTPEVVKSIGVASQYKIPRGYMIIRLR